MAVIMSGTSFNGTHASQYWLPALFEADTLDPNIGVVSVWDGIKSKVNISNMTFAGGLQPDQATPSTPYGTITVAEKVLAPQRAMLWMTYDPTVLENQWESADLSKLLLDRNLPADFTSYVLYSVMQNIFGQQMEVGWWQSSTAFQSIVDTTDPRYSLQFCDGFMKLIVNDATVLNYGSPAVITTSNILAMMDGLIDLIATNKKALLRRYKRMKFFFSPLTANIWRKYLVAAQYKGIDFNEPSQHSYAQYEIVVLNGIPDNTILFAEGVKDKTGAFHIGMNSSDDENNLMIEKTRWMDKTYGILGRMKFNTQIKFGNEIACMTTMTAASFNP
jgi:hypothetical protein